MRLLAVSSLLLARARRANPAGELRRHCRRAPRGLVWPSEFHPWPRPPPRHDSASPIDPAAPRQQSALAAAAAEPSAAAAEAASATPESDADGGYADSLSGFRTGSSTLEAETAARYAVSKRDRAQALDAIQAELASAVDKFLPRACYRAAVNRLEATVSLRSEWVTTFRFVAPSE